MGAAGTKRAKTKVRELQPVTPEYTLKLFLVGDAFVGKTSLIRRFCEGTWFENLYTMEDYLECVVDFGIFRVKLQTWDTRGNERFRTLGSAWYRGVHAGFAVYDVTNPETFQRVEKWLMELERYAENATRFLIGNKIDRVSERKVFEEAEELATKHSLVHYLTSAKDNTNVTRAFLHLAYECVMRLEEARPKDKNIDQALAFAERDFFFRHGNPEIILFLKYTDEDLKGKAKTMFYCLPIDVRDLIARTYVMCCYNKS